MKYPSSALFEARQHVKYMEKLVREKTPFIAKDYFLREKDISISRACRKDWGYSVDIDLPDMILSEQEAMDLCQEIYDRYNSNIIAKRLRETIDFLKVESVGGIWNTPQLIAMLEDLFKDDSK